MDGHPFGVDPVREKRRSSFCWRQLYIVRASPPGDPNSLVGASRPLRGIRHGEESLRASACRVHYPMAGSCFNHAPGLNARYGAGDSLWESSEVRANPARRGLVRVVERSLGRWGTFDGQQPR